MGKNFTNAKGTGSKAKAKQFDHKFGENRLRLVGNILARYVYWVSRPGSSAVPMECLAFNRDTEEFDNKEKDWMADPEFADVVGGKTSDWAYSILCIPEGSDELQVFNLKKKLFDQIKMAAEDLGDPTDPETGWDLVFKKEKTGPKTINVAYTVMAIKCSKSPHPLSDAEKALIAASPTIEALYPRPDPEKQREFLERIRKGAGGEDEPDDSITSEFDTD